MSDDSVQRILDELRGLRSEVAEVRTSIEGNEKMGVEGIVQHVRVLRVRQNEMEKDVKALKNDRSRVKAWVAGLTASGGIGAAVGSWFSK